MLTDHSLVIISFQGFNCRLISANADYFYMLQMLLNMGPESLRNMLKLSRIYSLAETNQRHNIQASGQIFFANTHKLKHFKLLES